MRHMEGASGVNMRGASSQQQVAQGIVWHIEGAGGVSMRGASSQRRATVGIARHMEGAEIGRAHV